jgi:hypothetical protein
MLKVLSSVATAAAAAAAEHESIITASLVRREQQLLRARTGASRQLVQGGLFDGRAIREAARRKDLDQSLEEESAQRLRQAGAMPIVGIDTRLVAILHVGYGRR